MLKKHALLIASGFTILLTIASFVKLNSIPKTGLSFEDKLFHFLAYAIFTLLWYNVFINHGKEQIKKYPLLIAFLIAIIYGIVIEVLQGQLTANRVTEFSDSVANSLGALFTVLVIKLKRLLVKKV